MKSTTYNGKGQQNYNKVKQVTRNITKREKVNSFHLFGIKKTSQPHPEFLAMSSDHKYI